MHSVTDRQTDGQTEDMTMPLTDYRSYCVAVRSANKANDQLRDIII